MIAASSTSSATSPSVVLTGTFWRAMSTLATALLLLLASCAGGVGVLLRRPSSGLGATVADSSINRFGNDLRHRKLLSPGPCSPLSADMDKSNSTGDQGKDYKPNRAWGEQDVCSESDIVIDQGPSSPLPNGIPTYSVAILNACSTGCDIAEIHVRCGKFSTARLIDPDIFKRLDYDDCLVYGGRPLPNGMTVSFQYANTYPYPMDVIKYQCCPV